MPPTDQAIARSIADLLLRHVSELSNPFQIINALGRCIKILAMAKRIITDTRARHAATVSKTHTRNEMAELVDDVKSAASLQSWVERGRKLIEQDAQGV